jgi:hypothetical protein
MTLQVPKAEWSQGLVARDMLAIGGRAAVENTT